MRNVLIPANIYEPLISLFVISHTNRSNRVTIDYFTKANELRYKRIRQIKKNRREICLQYDSLGKQGPEGVPTCSLPAW